MNTVSQAFNIDFLFLFFFFFFEEGWEHEFEDREFASERT